MIGKLEELVLLATLKAGEKSMPSEIHAAIIESQPQGERPRAFGAVYTTLSRMAAKGLLSEGLTQDQSGRDRRTFTVTAAGQRALMSNLQHAQALGGAAWLGAFA